MTSNDNSRMCLDRIGHNGYEIAFSIIPSKGEPVLYAEWERDPKYKVRAKGMVELPKGAKIPEKICLSFLKGEIVEEVPVTGVVERVPQHVTILGVRKRPTLELLAALLGIRYEGCESEGSDWMSMAEYLREIYPLDKYEQKEIEKFLSSELKSIKDKISERYHIAGIVFGVEPTIEGVYKRKSKLSRGLREMLNRAYGKRPIPTVI